MNCSDFCVVSVCLYKLSYVAMARLLLLQTSSFRLSLNISTVTYYVDIYMIRFLPHDGKKKYMRGSN